jgi:hypothetical protein
MDVNLKLEWGDTQYCSVKDFFLSSREQGDRSREKKEN